MRVFRDDVLQAVMMNINHIDNYLESSCPGPRHSVSEPSSSCRTSPDDEPARTSPKNQRTGRIRDDPLTYDAD
ncbi:hypothetical protein GWI33_017864 [Rhynchophorus ferrugineus]|uniref:Uncharacterized protein n=1 Tax=Rhynchophorus ferrugineus TaxID=354439 RepID=A0A834M785_RHYFE|nr:hypothetical protein GWI33_017864 [Rhynchophorus ferrugineus]